MTTQICSRCKVEKELVEYYGDKRTAKKLKAECKSCIKARMVNWRKNNPEKVLQQNIKRRRKKVD